MTGIEYRFNRLERLVQRIIRVLDAWLERRIDEGFARIEAEQTRAERS